MKNYIIKNEDVFSRQRGEDWISQRYAYFGASESFSLGAEILNAEYKWDTPFTLWCRKTGITVESQPNKYMQAGKLEEEKILQNTEELLRFKYYLNLKVHRSEETYFKKNYPFIGANLDGIVELEDKTLAGLEIKLVYNVYDWRNGRIPVYYWNQMQHCMLVTKLSVFFLVAKIQETGCFIFHRVAADIEYQEKLKKALISLQYHIEMGKRPELSNHKSEKPYLKVIAEKEEVLEERPDLAIVASVYEILEEQERVAKKRTQELKKIIESMIKPGHKVKAGDYKVEFSLGCYDSLDSKRLKEEDPETYINFLRKIERKTILIKRYKEEMQGEGV